MVLECGVALKVILILANGNTEKLMGMECIPGSMVTDTRVSSDLV